jgi:hypothetical protein
VAQDYPLSNNLNGRYSFGRIELTCRHNGSQETQWVLTSGLDRADQPTRLGGDKRRADLLMRHERLLDAGQLSAWLRYSRTQDLAIYSDLMGDLKTGIARTDWGFGYWHPLVDKWSAGFNFESTSQTSNNSLFQLKNLSLYAGLRWQMR